MIWLGDVEEKRLLKHQSWFCHLGSCGTILLYIHGRILNYKSGVPWVCKHGCTLQIWIYMCANVRIQICVCIYMHVQCIFAVCVSLCVFLVVLAPQTKPGMWHHMGQPHVSDALPRHGSLFCNSISDPALFPGSWPSSNQNMSCTQSCKVR